MAIAPDETTATDVVDEVVAWLEANWDPELSVAEWWERLGLAGWAAPSLPENAYGKGLSRGDAVRSASPASGLREFSARVSTSAASDGPSPRTSRSGTPCP